MKKTSILGFISGVVLATSGMILVSQDSARAFNPFGNGEDDSYAVVWKCPPGSDCLLLALLADPSAAGVINIGTSLKYNPSQWSFRSDLSGFLCDFTSNGGCPPANAPVGTFLLSDLPTIDFEPGDPLPGSNVLLINDKLNGVVSLDYSLSSPLLSEGDQNFFMFMFEARQAFNPFKTIIQTFDKPGIYDFTQLKATCSATIDGNTTTCGSDTPIYGINVTFIPVPEPDMTLGSITALVGLGIAFFKRKLKKSYADNELEKIS